MRYLLTFLLLLGIGFGQETSSCAEHEKTEKKVQIRKEIKDGKVTLSVTENGETEEFTADEGDAEAMAKLEKKLDKYDIDTDAKVYKKIIKHNCDKEDCDHKDCEHAKNVKVIKKYKNGDGECEHSNIDKEKMVWHMKDEDIFLTDEKAAYLGVHIQDLTEQLGDHFKVKDGGVLVSEVEKDSPAEKAGLKAGDIITKVDKEKVATTSELTKVVRSYEPESKVDIMVIRDGKTKKLDVKLGEAENPFYAHHDFRMPKEHKMMMKISPEAFKDLDFHSFEFDKQEFKAEMEAFKQELQKLKEELKQLQEEK